MGNWLAIVCDHSLGEVTAAHIVGILPFERPTAAAFIAARPLRLSWC